MDNLNLKRQKLEEYVFAIKTDVELKVSWKERSERSELSKNGDKALLCQNDVILEENEIEKAYRTKKEYRENNKDRILMVKLLKEMRRQLKCKELCFPIIKMMVDDNKENVTPYLIEWLYEQINGLTFSISFLGFQHRLNSRVSLFILNYPVTEKEYKNCDDYEEYERNEYNLYEENSNVIIDKVIKTPIEP